MTMSKMSKGVHCISGIIRSKNVRRLERKKKLSRREGKRKDGCAVGVKTRKRKGKRPHWAQKVQLG